MRSLSAATLLLPGSVVFPVFLSLLGLAAGNGGLGAIARQHSGSPHTNEQLKPLGRAEHETEHLVGRYEPDFVGVNRGIIGRADEESEVETLSNNQPAQGNVTGSQIRYYRYPKESLSAPKSTAPSYIPPALFGRESNEFEPGVGNVGELRKRGSEKTKLYITLNVCSQPFSTAADSDEVPEQLQVYISTSQNNQNPSANKNDAVLPVELGAGNLSIMANDDIFVSIEAPQNSDISGTYVYEITASIDYFYAVVHSDNNSAPSFIDSGAVDALFFTPDFGAPKANNDTNQTWMSDANFTLFVQNKDDPALRGLERSMCALKNISQIQGSMNVTISEKRANNGTVMWQQFYVKGLNSSSNYVAVLAVSGDSTDNGAGVVNGGGMALPSVSFSTKSDRNCAVIYNLSFCTDVAYAVPTNLTIWPNATALGEQYDTYAHNAYQPFNTSLQQIPCDTTSSAQYSLAKNCDDCDADYRKWLCAVTIPRCEDFTNPREYLMPRAVAYNFSNSTLNRTFENDALFSNQNRSILFYNSSRNPWIDTTIMPGPYKEILPCEELCYHLVQSCPAALQFACPQKGFGLEYSYGRNATATQCNSLTYPIQSVANTIQPKFFGPYMTILAVIAGLVIG